MMQLGCEFYDVYLHYRAYILRTFYFIFRVLKLDHLSILELLHGSSPPPQILGGDLKISGQNYWGGGGSEQKIKFGGELNLRGELKFEPQ